MRSAAQPRFLIKKQEQHQQEGFNVLQDMFVVDTEHLKCAVEVLVFVFLGE